MSKERRKEIEKKQKNKKALPIIIVAVVLLIGAVGLTASVIDKCDDCGATIVGSGYYKEKEAEGVIGSVIGSIFGDTESLPLETVEGAVICKECVKNNTSVKADLRPVSDFKR